MLKITLIGNKTILNSFRNNIYTQNLNKLVFIKMQNILLNWDREAIDTSIAKELIKT